MGLTQITTGGVDDNINIDSNTLKVDGTNNRVGIGTASPSAPLDVETSNDIVIEARSTDRYAHIDLIDNAASSRFTTDGATGTLRLRADIGNAAASSAIQFEVDGSEKARIDSSGLIRIGDGTVNAAAVGAGPTVSITGDAPEITLRDSATGTPYVWMATNDAGSLILAADQGNNAASSIIDFRVDGTERMRIDQHGRVGINNTSPNSQFHNDLVIGTGSGSDAGLTIHTSTSGRGSIAFSDGTSGTSRYDGYLQYDHSNQSFKIYTNGGNERLRVDSSGRLLIGESSAPFDSSNALLQIGATDGANMVFYRDNTPVNSGSSLGLIRFFSNAGSSKQEHARISGISDGTSGANDKPGRLEFYTTADSASSPTERMRIDKNGNVGIGSQNPVADLVVSNGGASGIELQPEITTNTNRITNFNRSSSSYNNFRLDAAQHEFLISGSEKVRIDSAGKLLVGTASSQDSISYIQSVRTSGNSSIRVQSDALGDSDVCIFSARYAKSGGTAQFTEVGAYKHSGITNPSGYLRLPNIDLTAVFMWNDTSNNFRTSTNASHIGTTSGTVVGTQTSDERLKNVGADVAYGLAEIKQLETKQYALKTEPDTNKLGFIAQQVESIIPEAVYDTGEELDGHEDGDRTKLGMEYVQLIPVLVNAIKELSAEVDTLKTKVAALKSN